ncbi:conjugal transfer protein TraD [Sphingomonas sp. PR090111-T3T-6A]|uniref:conjugal transfer protein TraD n=1 Tax=Sphingomonas sp. PR090111-T3T-6A TaxID=685778 RepID=UPI00036A3EDB|nr:conjugal transfer protein TraD [Sphingomonas sp. PR090111-T3T-6A]
MRKPRDFDAELKALDDKAKRLKEQRRVQLGELVIACGADGVAPETLAGALLALSDADASTTEVWRQRGAAFFQRAPRKPARGSAQEPNGTLPFDRPAQPA